MNKTHRDKAYLLHLREQPCLFTGIRGSDNESVVAAHWGTQGKGIKSPDYWASPVSNHIHQMMHTQGEMTTLRKMLPDDMLREAMRALARQDYEEWKNG